MALTPETQKLLMELLKVKQPESIAAPISPYEAIQMDKGLLSTDPVISKLQKVGRGVKSLLEPETPVDYLMSGLGPAKAIQTINKGKKIYHGTNAKYKDFDLDKSADGTMWFSDNKGMVQKGYDGASGNKYVMERTIDEKALKLADWDMADKYMLPQLVNMGYDGIKYVDPQKKDIVYQIFNPEKLNKKLIKPLSEKEFYKKYDMHHDLRGGSTNYPKSNSVELKNKILQEGITSGWVNNAYPGIKGRPGYFDKKFGTKKGQTTYLVPKSNVDKDGIKIVKPYKISEEEILNFDYDFQPAYEAYLKNFNK
jgi:hypothetical protein